MKKHTPLRMCMSCREMKPKEELFRVVSLDGTAVVDEKSNIQARGAYVSRTEKCVTLLRKKRCVERHLKADAKDVYTRLEQLLCKD